MATDIRDMRSVPTTEGRMTSTDARAPEREEKKTTAEVVAGGSMIEAIGGIAAVVLAIIGLATVGWLPLWMAAISAIVLGGAILLKGMSVAARYRTLLDVAEQEEGPTTAELGGGMSAEVLGGCAGIVLGILALVHIAPISLISVAAVVFGGTLVLGCGTNVQINDLYLRGPNFRSRPMTQHVMSDILSAANGLQALVGLGAIVLGVLALCGIAPLMLSLVSFLSVGAAVMLSGGAVSGKLATMIWR